MRAVVDEEHAGHDQDRRGSSVSAFAMACKALATIWGSAFGNTIRVVTCHCDAPSPIPAWRYSCGTPDRASRAATATKGSRRTPTVNPPGQHAPPQRKLNMVPGGRRTRREARAADSAEPTETVHENGQAEESVHHRGNSSEMIEISLHQLSQPLEGWPRRPVFLDQECGSQPNRKSKGASDPTDPQDPGEGGSDTSPYRRTRGRSG